MSRGLTGASFASLALGLLTVAACGDTGLQPGILANVVDTVTLYALDGTALQLPSAYSISTASVVRTDQSSSFDFAFNITSGNAAVLLPTGALHLGIGSGIDTVAAPFDAITVVPGGAYVDSLPVRIDSGTVAVVHSRATSCPITGSFSFLYAKLQVLAIDTVAKSLTMQVLANKNCGYRSLEPGNPTR
ncbi:MAG TPA: hypothetical protein VKB45_09750 [Gemmatimonadales bacterium]|nr:hypothetical protein [Gemmatimonadales bacterium]